MAREIFGDVPNIRVESFTGLQAQRLQGLFSTAYAGLTTYNDKAAFQLAVWETVLETGNLLNVNTGSFTLLGDAAANAAAPAGNEAAPAANAAEGEKK